MNDHKAESTVSASNIPEVSIGMPVYNGEKFIAKAIDSLLAQTYTNFELIISDNASTDQTEAICRNYAAIDRRIRYVRQLKNMGASANFQYVLNEAVGEYFMWAAADDMWSKTYLFNAVNALLIPSISFAFPSFELRSMKLRLSKKFNKRVFEFIHSSDKKLRVISFLNLHHNSHKCNIVYSLFRKKFLKSVVSIKNIENDGVMGSVILSLGRGKIIEGALFSKRYSVLWPGALSIFNNYALKFHRYNFDFCKNESYSSLIALFPEYTDQIKIIFASYKPYSHKSLYSICNIRNK